MPDDAPLLLDVSRLIWRRWKGRLPTGIDRVCLAYLRHFGDRSQAVVQHRLFRRILDPRASKALFALLEGPQERFRWRLVTGILRHLGAGRSSGKHRLYLNVGHTGLDSDGYRAWAGKSDVRPVYLVHDLIPITHPQSCRPGEAERHRQRMRTVLATGTGVIGNSRATLDKLAEFAAAEGLPMPASHAAPLGVDLLRTHPATEPSGKPTFVALGTIEGRKNHLLLLTIWSRLVDRLGSEAPRLLIIGQRGWEAEQVFDLLDHSEKLRDHVIELNHCSDEEVAGYLSSARALLFPSFAEGYGLPLVEALAARVPVVASDLPVFRELCGDLPVYLRPDDESAWEASILDFAKPDSVERARQVKEMAAYRPPTWEEHFSSVEAWLQTLG